MSANEAGKWKRLKDGWNLVKEKTATKWKAWKAAGNENDGNWWNSAGKWAATKMKDLGAAIQDGTYALAESLDNTIDGTLMPGFGGAVGKAAAGIGSGLLRGIGAIGGGGKNLFQWLKTVSGDHALTMICHTPGKITNFVVDHEDNNFNLELGAGRRMVLSTEPKITKAKSPTHAFKSADGKQLEYIKFPYRPKKMRIKTVGMTLSGVTCKFYDDIKGMAVTLSLNGGSESFIYLVPKFNVKPTKVSDNVYILKFEKMTKAARAKEFTAGKHKNFHITTPAAPSAPIVAPPVGYVKTPYLPQPYVMPGPAAPSSTTVPPQAPVITAISNSSMPSALPGF